MILLIKGRVQHNKKRGLDQTISHGRNIKKYRLMSTIQWEFQRKKLGETNFNENGKILEKIHHDQKRRQES